MNEQTVFWGRFYKGLIGATALGLVLSIWLGWFILLAICICIWSLLVWIMQDTDRRAERLSRRKRTLPPKPSEYPGTDEAHRFRRMQEQINVENWNTSDHTEPPATGGKNNG